MHGCMSCFLHYITTARVLFHLQERRGYAIVHALHFQEVYTIQDSCSAVV